MAMDCARSMPLELLAGIADRIGRLLFVERAQAGNAEEQRQRDDSALDRFSTHSRHVGANLPFDYDHRTITAAGQPIGLPEQPTIHKRRRKIRHRLPFNQHAPAHEVVAAAQAADRQDQPLL
ncbi:MAG: hypothetical protein QME60_08715 [Verrucomicrobiota bacterium]|nr:hypothetical protein [Verrucomicrobiota bacterium]